MSLIAHVQKPGSKRFSRLVAPLVLAFIVLAFLPTAAQAAAATISPQPGTQGQLESDGRGGRPPYGTFHWRHNRRGGPRHNFHQQPRHHYNNRQCCERHSPPSGQHRNHGYDDGKGHRHGHGEHPNRKGHDNNYDRDHKHYGYDDDKYDHGKYEDNYDEEDKGYDSREAPYDSDTEEKGGEPSAAETTEEVAPASEEAAGEEKGGVAPSDTVTETATVTDTAAITNSTDVSGTVANGDADGDAIVFVNSNDELGEFLVDANGMTLYRFDRDTADASFCTGDCAVTWPPMLVEADAQLVAGEGISGELAAIVRDDGTVQVTYNGSPLYTFADDQQPGDVTGQGVGGAWNVVA